MAKNRGKKKPKQKKAVLSKNITDQKRAFLSRAIPDDGQERVFFSFEIFDGRSRWCDSSPKDALINFWDVAEKLKSFQQRKWAEIAAKEDRDHTVDTDRIIRDAQKVLEHREYEDFDLWSFHINGTQRIWGIRERDMFMVLWWDPHHKVCPSLKN